MKLAQFLFLLAMPLLAACGGSTIADGDGTLTIIGAEDCDARPPLVSLATFQAATLVVGQPDFVTEDRRGEGIATSDSLKTPCGLGCGSLWVADWANSRVLRFPAPLSATGALPQLVLGQTNFVSGLPQPTSASSLDQPTAVVQRDGKVFVCDRSNHRILIWNSLPLTHGQPADIVVGQVNFTNDTNPIGLNATSFTPTDCAVAEGRLLVADEGGRVLIWSTIPSVNGAPADLVIGARDFTSSSDTVSATNLDYPIGVWTDGTRVAVADFATHRVVIWNTFPTGNGQAADVVLGQVDMETAEPGTSQTRMDKPLAVDSNSTQLAVIDGNNHRVLVWDSFPTSDGQPADVVLGQANFARSQANDDDQDGSRDDNPSARTFDFIEFGTWTFTDLRFSARRLYVSDAGNHRVLVFQ